MKLENNHLRTAWSTTSIQGHIQVQFEWSTLTNNAIHNSMWSRPRLAEDIEANVRPKREHTSAAQDHGQNRIAKRSPTQHPKHRQPTRKRHVAWQTWTKNGAMGQRIDLIPFIFFLFFLNKITRGAEQGERTHRFFYFIWGLSLILILISNFIKFWFPLEFYF